MSVLYVCACVECLTPMENVRRRRFLLSFHVSTYVFVNEFNIEDDEQRNFAK